MCVAAEGHSSLRCGADLGQPAQGLLLTPPDSGTGTCVLFELMESHGGGIQLWGMNKSLRV